MALVSALSRFATKVLQFVLLLPVYVMQLAMDVHSACVCGLIVSAPAMLVFHLASFDYRLGLLWAPPVALLVFGREFHRHFIKGEGMGFNDVY